jgi:hypothetical protein
MLKSDGKVLYLLVNHHQHLNFKDARAVPIAKYKMPVGYYYITGSITNLNQLRLYGK